MSTIQIKNTQENGLVKIHLAGRFDFNSHRQFREAFEKAIITPNVNSLEIDLGSVEYLDSSALGMLLLVKEKAANANKSVALTNCRGVVQQVLEVANFSKLFTIR